MVTLKPKNGYIFFIFHLRKNEKSIKIKNTITFYIK